MEAEHLVPAPGRPTGLRNLPAEQYQTVSVPWTCYTRYALKLKACGSAAHQLPSLSLVAANSSPNRRWSGSTARASR